MAFVNNTLELRAWDNYDVGTWEDPLHLVGSVGIYDRAFGFGTQGAMIQETKYGVTGRFLYSDNFEDGGQGVPANDPFFGVTDDGGFDGDLAYLETGPDGRFVLRDAVRDSYRFNSTSGDEDIMAARVWRDVGRFRVAASARMDRGYNPASYGFLENVQDRDVHLIDSGAFPDTLTVRAQTATRTTFDTGTEQWWGVGVDAVAPDVLGTVDLTGEVLFGKAEYVGRFGRRDNVVVATVPGSLIGATEDAAVVVTNDGRRPDHRQRISTAPTGSRRWRPRTSSWTGAGGSTWASPTCRACSASPHRPASRWRPTGRRRPSPAWPTT